MVPFICYRRTKYAIYREKSAAAKPGYFFSILNILCTSSLIEFDFSDSLISIKFIGNMNIHTGTGAHILLTPIKMKNWKQAICNR